jgi:hypothetical protein
MPCGAFRIARSTHSTRMVNGWFPQDRRIWFRNGAWSLHAATQGINRKFTPNHDTIFSGFRRDLTPMQTLAIYRRWSGILSTTVRDRVFGLNATEQESAG